MVRTQRAHPSRTRRNPSIFVAPTWWQTVGLARVEHYLEENGVDDPRVVALIEQYKELTQKPLSQGYKAVDARHRAYSDIARELTTPMTLPKVTKRVRDAKGREKVMVDRSKTGKLVIPIDVGRNLLRPEVLASFDREW